MPLCVCVFNNYHKNKRENPSQITQKHFVCSKFLKRQQNLTTAAVVVNSCMIIVFEVFVVIVVAFIADVSSFMVIVRLLFQLLLMSKGTFDFSIIEK